MDDDALIGTTVDGRYRVLDLLGEGGMARVYSATQLTLGREVALKILRGEVARRSVASQRFLREAQIGGALSHSNTVRILDVGRDGPELLYIAMERLRGVTLRALVDEQGALPLDRAVRIAVQICLSLAEADAAGLVHRDLKPENVFVTREFGRSDYVRVLDFGIVKLLDDPGLIHLTATGTAIGTPAYMSPEAAMAKPVSIRSDLYSLGVMLFEMASGVAPYVGDSPISVMLKHAADPIPSLAAARSAAALEGDVARLEEVVTTLMAKDPKDRYATPADVIHALAGVGNVGVKVRADPEESKRPSGSPARAGGASHTAPTLLQSEPRDFEQTLVHTMFEDP